MADVDTKLRDQGIDVPTSPGNHYTTCPQCSDARKGINRRKKCLSVAVGPTKITSGMLEQGEAVWNCLHCGWHGGFGNGHNTTHGGAGFKTGGKGYRPATGFGKGPSRPTKRFW